MYRNPNQVVTRSVEARIGEMAAAADGDAETEAGSDAASEARLKTALFVAGRLGRNANCQGPRSKVQSSGAR